MCAFANQAPLQEDYDKVQKAIDKCNEKIKTQKGEKTTPSLGR